MAAPKNPKGFKSEKIWREAVTRAVLRLDKTKNREGQNRALDMLANSLVRTALDGDITALKEIGDRLDGKPRQEVENTVIDKTAEDRLARLNELLS